MHEMINCIFLEHKISGNSEDALLSPMKYTVMLTEVKMMIFVILFLIFCSKHRGWVLIRAASMVTRTCSQNLYFGQKREK